MEWWGWLTVAAFILLFTFYVWLAYGPDRRWGRSIDEKVGLRGPAGKRNQGLLVVALGAIAMIVLLLQGLLGAGWSAWSVGNLILAGVLTIAGVARARS